VTSPRLAQGGCIIFLFTAYVCEDETVAAVARVSQHSPVSKDCTLCAPP
jgi:hypothetical protein